MKPQRHTTSRIWRHGLMAALCIGALAGTARAERIEESDLPGGALPAALAVGTDFTGKAKAGTSYTVAEFFDASKLSMFDLRSASGYTEWYIEVTLAEPCLFSTYAVNVNKHNSNQGANRAPKSWEVYGALAESPNEWTLLSSESGQTGWNIGEVGGAGETRLFHFENAATRYKHLRFKFLASNGNSSWMLVSGITLYGALPGVYFENASIGASDGSFVVSGTLAAESSAADVTLHAATNGVPFEVELGAVQPGGGFSATIPGPGVASASLVGVSGEFTASVSAGVAYVAGSDAVRFVSPDGDDSAAGETPDAPMLHIASAVESLGTAGGAVYVLPGDYAEANDLSAVVLTAPVAVIGATGDPADASVTASGAPCGYARVFRLANAAARVSGLTIYGGHVLNEPSDGQTAAEANASLTSGTAANGGNVWIESAGGTVENCIIRDGTVERFSTAGGNVFLQGGRLSRCILTGGKLSTNLDLTEKRPCGTSLYARGGVIESCFFTGTRQSVVPVCVEGSAKLLNCTVAGNTGKSCGGVVVKTAAATIANTVIYDNRVTADGGNAVWMPLTGVDATAASARFTACATDGAAINSACRVVDSAAFAAPAAGDYAPASRQSPLVNRGIDYMLAGGVSSYDLAGNPRIWKARIDIGAYELPYYTDPAFTMVVR